MGSSVSRNSKSIVTQTTTLRHKSEGKNEQCTYLIQSSSQQYQKSDYTDTPTPSSSSRNETLPPSDNSKMLSNQTSEDIIKEAINEEKQVNDDGDAGTDKGKDKEKFEIEEIMTDEEEMADEDISTDEENMTDEDIMTDEELEQFRGKTFKILRETAMELVALNICLERGEYITEIENAVNIFNSSHFVLEKTVRANIEKFRRDIAQLMMETKYFGFCCKLVIHSYKSGWHLKDERVYKILPYQYMVLLQNFCDSSDDMAIAMPNEPGFVKIVKQMLEDFLPKYFEKENKLKLTKIEEDMVDSALAIAHNMSMRESNVSKLRDAGMIACLQPYLKSPNNEHALSALACLAGIINEKECDIINSNKQIVIHLLNCIRRGLKNKMRTCEEGWSCKECGFTIKLLARNDANVKTLVDLGALELLVELGKIGDEDEQYESVSALWALCFDKENQTLITEKPELGVVDLLVHLKSSEDEKIKKACNGALWTLRDALKKTSVEKYKEIGEQFDAHREKRETQEDEKKQVVSEYKASSQGHVMISYQWADQEVLKNVRNNIRARGYKVWMDIDQMGGSTLQAMADAVEGADVFLLCMSNKYKHSPTCRAEAEYAFQLRKHVIPLKMERGYTPDGWLGFIVGAKLFFEFSSKYPFEDKMKALLKEIDSLLGRAEDMPDSGNIIAPQIASVTTGVSAYSVSHADTASPVSNTVAKTSVSKTTIDNVSKWTADDVVKWIEKNDLQNCEISSLTGGELALLASLRVECPEYFYKCLEKKLKIKDLMTISKVFLAFHNLS